MGRLESGAGCGARAQVSHTWTREAFGTPLGRETCARAPHPAPLSRRLMSAPLDGQGIRS